MRACDGWVSSKPARPRLRWLPALQSSEVVLVVLVLSSKRRRRRHHHHHHQQRPLILNTNPFCESPSKLPIPTCTPFKKNRGHDAHYDDAVTTPSISNTTVDMPDQDYTQYTSIPTYLSMLHPKIIFLQRTYITTPHTLEILEISVTRILLWRLSLSSIVEVDIWSPHPSPSFSESPNSNFFFRPQHT